MCMLSVVNGDARQYGCGLLCLNDAAGLSMQTALTVRTWRLCNVGDGGFHASLRTGCDVTQGSATCLLHCPQNH